MAYKGGWRGPSAGGTDVTVFPGVSPAVDDIMTVGWYVESSAAAITPPVGAGWMLKVDIPLSGGFRFLVFWKRMVAGDSSWLFTQSVSAYREVNAWLHSGRATTGDPFEGGAANGFLTVVKDTAGTTMTIPAVTSSAGADLIAVGAAFEYEAWTPPAGMTEVHDFGQNMGVGSLANVADGSSGTKTFTVSVSSALKGFLGSLKAAGSSNAAPTVSAGTAQTVDPNLVDTFTLTATGSDTDGTIASYLWEDITSGATVVAGSGASRTRDVPRTVAGSTRTYRVTVTDNGGATATSTVVVTVLPHTRWLKTSSSLAPLRHHV